MQNKFFTFLLATTLCLFSLAGSSQSREGSTAGEVSSSLKTCQVPEQTRNARHLDLAFTGDILVHKILFEMASQSRLRFLVLWQKVTPLLQDADLTIGNLEGPVAPGRSMNGRTRDPGFKHDGTVYSGTNFVFNYHPYLLDDLKSSGFDILSTANNHSLDRGPDGIDDTLEEIRARNLIAVGTRSKSGTSDFLKTVEKKGFKIGLIACSEMLNGFKDRFNQVLSCGSAQVQELVKRSSQTQDITIVLPHWGDEYQTQASKRQRNWAKSWIAAGADLIVGNHPHVLQTVDNLESGGRQAIVIYSLGNFIAAQRDIHRRTTAIVRVRFAKNTSGATSLMSFRYTPVLRPSGSIEIRPADPNKHEEEWKLIQRQLGPELCRKR